MSEHAVEQHATDPIAASPAETLESKLLAAEAKLASLESVVNGLVSGHQTLLNEVATMVENHGSLASEFGKLVMKSNRAQSLKNY